jgi:hypothetical protein
LARARSRSIVCSPHTIGGFKAHGFAILIGTLLIRAAALADRRPWHIVGLITHLFLGAGNLLFWSSFVAHDLIVVGVVTTALHAIFAVAQGSCAKREL